MLKDKVAIITGAASGMGAVHAEKFVEAKAKVMLVDIKEEEGKKLAGILGENARFMKLDVSNQEGWFEVVKETEAAFGPIDILVNNAGMGIFKPIADLTDEEFRKIIDVNLMSIFYSFKAVIPSMRKKKKGSIINISSVDGLRGASTSGAYCASKFGVNGLSKCAALEYGAENIRVNTVHPGLIWTPMAAAPEIKEAIEQIKKRIPMNRCGECEEVSNLVIFLASDKSSFITGAEFVIDGGMISQI
ncbi:MAG TPA: glucose 1-dehydrogenase [Acholeplasmataceae bacterium]|nr:glucose 1-dehydrogenase [Acholeplasmataceae bacterium]